MNKLIMKLSIKDNFHYGMKYRLDTFCMQNIDSIDIQSLDKRGFFEPNNEYNPDFEDDWDNIYDVSPNGVSTSSGSSITQSIILKTIDPDRDCRMEISAIDKDTLSQVVKNIDFEVLAAKYDFVMLSGEVLDNTHHTDL